MNRQTANQWNENGTPCLFFDRGVRLARTETAVERLARLRRGNPEMFRFFVEVCHGDGWVEGLDERRDLYAAGVIDHGSSMAKAAERQVVLRCTKIDKNGDLTALDWERAVR